MVGRIVERGPTVHSFIRRNVGGEKRRGKTKETRRGDPGWIGRGS